MERDASFGRLPFVVEKQKDALVFKRLLLNQLI
jgi:hypothetical protein